MKRLTLYVLALVAVVFVGDRLISCAAIKLIQLSKNQFVKMYEGRNRADILFLGDSRIDRNIDFLFAESAIGKVCLNLGLGGNSVVISEVLLRDYIDRYGNPRLVVIEMGHSMVSPLGMGEMRIFSYSSPRIAELAQRISPTYSLFESIFRSLKFNDPAFWRLIGEVIKEPSNRLLTSRIPQVILEKWNRDDNVTLPIFDENLEALKRIVDFADNNKLEVKFIITPCWVGYKKKILNFESWKSQLQEAIGKHNIFDYSGIFGSQPSYFNDTIHLNSLGARLLVERMIMDKVL